MVYQGIPPAYGSMLKGAKPGHEPAPKRVAEPKHLVWIRGLPCIAGGKGRVQAAHLRMASAKHGKPITGTGVRPDDKWATPLSKEAHDRQHVVGEPVFWAELGIDPFDLCLELHAVSGDVPKAKKIIARVQRAARAAAKRTPP